MTRLTKPVRRLVQGKVVTLYPHGVIGLREYKRRREHFIPVGMVYTRACWVTAESEKKQREQKRQDARKARGLPPLKKLVSRGLIGGSR